MILTGPKILEEVEAGRIVIEPFDPGQINPNSYDFRLSEELLCYTDRMLDSAVLNPSEMIEFPPGGLVLRPDRVYLGCTVETMGSEFYVPIIRGKSSLARLGLFINMTADLIDLGSVNQWTLQFHAIEPLRIYPKMLIGQVTFWIPEGEKVLYSGKYQGSRGPRASLSYEDCP
ncbi:dCTP deaminase [Tessaracoccus caeni]|uniref:dCTP deaminase n=1 Tax=Tessaracoccus caeni TaxID=3031239 RepID=UPI0023D9D020|nr:dCTP deaminase [Tessaracoccus caeni]MDF1489391.1 dCTP deaminase [Tessaracoccus caeni]